MTLIDLPPSDTVAALDDETLVANLGRLVARERALIADFVIHLAELDRRQLYLEKGYPSLFAWLTEAAHFSNASAYRRVTAARLQARMPAVAAYLREGRLSLKKLSLLKDVLAPENCLALLERAASSSEKDVEELACVLDPARATPPPPDKIRPVRAPVQQELFAEPPTSAAEAAAPVPVRHVIQMTVGPEFMARLDRLRAAWSHTHPGAGLETLLGEAMRVALDAHDRRARALTDRPRAASAPPKRRSRHIPAAVRRAVWARDAGRCTYVSDDGHRCDGTHQLQWDHIVPFARGGPATIDNIRLRCRRHNVLAARAAFGAEKMRQYG